MAWNDPVLDQRLAAARGPSPQRGIDLGGTADTLNRGLQERANLRDRTSQSIRATAAATRPEQGGWEPAELAFNPTTRKWAVQGQNGIAELDQTPATLFALADMDLPTMADLPEGYRPVSRAQLQNALANVETESDFFGQLGSSFVQSIGLAAAAIDSMIGNDDPNNYLTGAAERRSDSQSLGQFKASQDRWYEGIPQFLSGAGQSLGNIAGTAVGAIPGIVAGAAAGSAASPGVGTAAGALTSAGVALTGGMQAFGEQATEFYSMAAEELSAMSPEQALAEVPLYAEIAARDANLTHEEIAREVAIRGARAAGAPAAALGGVEALVGGRLAGNVLRRMGAGRTGSTLGGGVREGVLGSRTRRIGGLLGRSTAAGVGAGVTEMAESGFGQAAGAQLTGIGDPTVMGNVDIEEGIAASQTGFILGALGGRGRAGADAAVDAARNDIGEALGATAGKTSPQPESGPTVDPAMEVPSILRRGVMEPGGQRALPLDMLGGEAAPPAAPVAPPAAPPAGPVADPAQQDMFADQLGPRPPDNIDQQQMAAAQAQQQREEAIGILAGEFGIDATNPEQVQAAMPQLLELADEAPQFRMLMEAAGIYPNLLEASPEAQAQALGETQQAFLNMPAPPPGPPRPGNQVPVDRQQSFNWGSRVRGPASASRAAVSMQVPEGPAQVDTPEPLSAPAERTPDGRPVGVAPSPLENPEPMPPGQVEQGATTRAQRRRRAGAAANEVPPAPAPVTPEQAAQVSEQGVADSTAEPAEDIAAQLEALADPQSERDAVFLATGTTAGASLDSLPPGAQAVNREGVGTLITTNDKKAQQFRRSKLTDKVMANILGYSEDKAEVMRSGEPPVVVEARTPDGRVQAQQVSTPRNARAAKAAVRRQARADAAVQTTTPEAAQEDRARRIGPKARRPATAASLQEAPRQSKKKSPATEVADEPAPQRRRTENLNDTTVDDRAIARAQVQGEPQAAPRLDISTRAANTPRSIKVGNQTREIGNSLITETGEAGAVVDLRVQAVNENLREDLRNATAEGRKVAATDFEYAERVLRDMDQLDTMLEAAVDAAEERLLDRLDASPEGRSLLEATRAIKLREELRERRRQRAEAGQSLRGRRPGRTKESPLTFVPLLAQEALEFGRLARQQARAELQGEVEPARSVARRMIGQILPGMQNRLENVETLRETLEAFANLTDEQLDGHVRAAHGPVLRDSLLAKQVMRGASEVAHEQAREDAEVVTGRRRRSPNAEPQEEAEPAPPQYDPMTAEQLGLVEEKVGRVDTYEGDLPAEAVQTVDGWLEMLERGGTKMTGRLQVLSWDTAHLLYPEAFPRSTMGRFAQVQVGEKTVHVIAVNWNAIASDAYAIEVLAHEFGHYAAVEVFNRSDRATQEAIKASYYAWLNLQGGRQPVEIFRDHAPALLRTMASEFGTLTHDYVTDFAEWSASHVARHLLTRPEPRGIVEKYFARVADMLRQVWASLTGSAEPNLAWSEAIDGWIARGAAANAGPERMDAGPHNMEWVGEPGAEPEQPAGLKRAQASVRRDTRGLEGAKDAWTDFFKGERHDAEAVKRFGDRLYDEMMSTRIGKYLRRTGLSLMTLDQIERRFRDSPIGKPLTKWVGLMKQKAQLANFALFGGEFTLPGGEKITLKGADRAIGMAQQLAPKTRELLEKVMYYATHYGVHPDQSWEDNKHLHGEGVSEAVEASNRRRYEQVSAMWQQLVDTQTAAPQIYAELRDAFMDMHEQTLSRLIANIEESELSDKAKADGIKRVKDYQRTLRQGPYFPLMRFGDWIVEVTQPAEASFHKTRAEAETARRDQRQINPGARVTVSQVDGEWVVRTFRRGVYFFDSAAEASNARAQIEADLQEQYENAGVSLDEVRKALDEGQLVDKDGKREPLISNPFERLDSYGSLGEGSQFLSELRAEAAANNVRIDPEMAALMERLYIESLPEMSARKSMLPRQNVLGASQKMLTAYATRFSGAAHAFSGVTFGREIDKAWRDMEAARKGYEPAGAVLNNLRASQQAIAERTRDTFGNKVLNTLTDASSLFSLGFSPAYVMTNAMQVLMITTPTLAGTIDKSGNLIGAAKAGRYVKEAYASAPQFFTKRGMRDFIEEAKRLFGQQADTEGLHKSAEVMIAEFGKNDEERAMLTRLLESGRLDFSFLNSIEDAMRGSTASQKFGNVARLGMALPQQIEAMNRVVTALASFRMAKAEMGFDDAQASNFAYDVVGDTQLDYSRLNRPLLFNKQLPSVILQFKLYMQGMISLFVRNAYLATKGQTPEQRKQGRATLMYLMGTHGAIGGATGLGPMALLAKFGISVAAALMGRPDDDDEWKSPEQILSEKARYVFGDRGGQVFERGLPTLLGLDVADRISFPDLFDTRYANIRDGDTAGTGLDKLLLYSLGAPYSNVRRVVEAAGGVAGADDMAEARRALVKGLPSGPRAMANALAVSTEGILERDGDTFIPREDLNWLELGIMATGYQPASTARAYRERGEEKGTLARIRDSRSKLLQRWRNADRDQQARLRVEIREFNESVPRGFRVKESDMRRSVQTAQKREAGRVNRDEQAIRDYLQ